MINRFSKIKEHSLTNNSNSMLVYTHSFFGIEEIMQQKYIDNLQEKSIEKNATTKCWLKYKKSINKIAIKNVDKIATKTHWLKRIKKINVEMQL